MNDTDHLNMVKRLFALGHDDEARHLMAMHDEIQRLTKELCKPDDVRIYAPYIPLIDVSNVKFDSDLVSDADDEDAA